MVEDANRLPSDNSPGGDAAVNSPIPAIAATIRPSPQVVSVITPTGNRRVLLQQALGYFRSQDYPHIEWLILDDSAAVDEILANLPDRNIHYEHYAGPRLTIGEKRNRLVEKARGEIIVHFDDDDFYAPCYVGAMVSALADNNADLINLRGWYVYDRRSDFFGYWDLMHKDGPHYCCDAPGVSIVMLDQEAFKFNHLGYGFSYAYKRPVWEKYKFPAKDIAEDGEFTQAAALQFSISGVHDTIGRCLHILHAGSTSRCFPQYLLPGFELAQRFPAYGLAPAV